MHPALHAIPPALRKIVDGYTWLSVANGMSDAAVFELRAAGRSRRFLKTEKSSPFSEVDAEGERLAWLSSKGILCSEIVAHVADENRSWLMTTALTGVNLASATASLSPATVVRIAADGLIAMHSLDQSSCPFDHRAAKTVEQARQRMLAGLVDEDNFDESRRGLSAAELFEQLLLSQPEDEDIVVTHGDASLPNLMADGDEFMGFIDLGRLGCADRHRDLALMARDIAADLGPEWVEHFFQLYGRPVDPTKLKFFELLDEFF